MPYILFARLYNPFDAHDDINAENLVASTELALFNSMRCQFREISAESDVDDDNELRSERTMVKRNPSVRTSTDSQPGDSAVRFYNLDK